MPVRYFSRINCLYHLANFFAFVCIETKSLCKNIFLLSFSNDKKKKKKIRLMIFWFCFSCTGGLQVGFTGHNQSCKYPLLVFASLNIIPISISELIETFNWCFVRLSTYNNSTIKILKYSSGRCGTYHYIFVKKYDVNFVLIRAHKNIVYLSRSSKKTALE